MTATSSGPLDAGRHWLHTRRVPRVGLSHGVLVSAAFAAVLAACSGSSGGQAGPCSGSPVATVPSKSGALTVAVCLSQEPPYAGDLNAELTITQTSGNTPVDGLTLQVVPWMPQMGHGTSVVPTIEAEGGGKYLVNNLYLFMSGTWALQTTLSGAATDSVDPQFDVQ
jgi:hypothetical protein